MSMSFSTTKHLNTLGLLNVPDDPGGKLFNMMTTIHSELNLFMIMFHRCGYELFAFPSFEYHFNTAIPFDSRYLALEHV
jgi:hypothetical protein